MCCSRFASESAAAEVKWKSDSLEVARLAQEINRASVPSNHILSTFAKT